MNNDRNHLLRLTVSALCVALGLVLPFLTGQIPAIGKMLSPMHIPVFLCGFLAGPLWGGAVGFVTPLLRSVLFQMPALYPNAVCMAFELCVYGVTAGWFYRLLPKKLPYLYLSLIGAMLAGRVVFGVVKAALLTMDANLEAYTWKLFLAEAFVNAVPGIILHLVAVPLLVVAIRRAVPSLRGLNDGKGRKKTE